MKYKAGDLVTVDAGTPMWSIDLQATVTFSKETIYKIKHLSASSGKPIFGKRCEILFENFGIPGVMETKNEFGLPDSIKSFDQDRLKPKFLCI